MVTNLPNEIQSFDTVKIAQALLALASLAWGWIPHFLGFCCNRHFNTIFYLFIDNPELSLFLEFNNAVCLLNW